VTQSPIQGVSFADALDKANAPSKHHTQYFEMMGHRSIYHNGWRGVCPWPGPSFSEAGHGFGDPIPAEKLTELDAKAWELYHVDTDFTENNNVAGEFREKLIEMVATWYVEAGKYNVLPVDGRGQTRFADPRPQIAEERVSYTYYPDTQCVPTNSAAVILNRTHSITADVEIQKGGAEGVLLSAGDIQGGYTFYVKDGKLHYGYNYAAQKIFRVDSNVKVPEGRHKLRFQFEVTGQPQIRQGKGTPGQGQLFVDGKMVGEAEIPLTLPLSLGLGGGIVCGADTGATVIPDYQSPFAFTGKIHSVTVDVSGDTIKDSEMQLRHAMAHQ